MLKKYFRPTLEPDLIERFSQFRMRRLIQIAGFTLIGLLIAAFISYGIAQLLFITGCIALICSIGFSVNKRPLPAAYILLWSMTIMLSALAFLGAGMLDYALLGYPGLLMYAAILGSVALFYSLLLFVLATCTLLTWLTLSGLLVPHTQVLSWFDLIFVFIILTVTAMSVYLMVKDMRNLMKVLHQENIKVKHSRVKIERLAHYDLLTGLPNRVFGEQLYLQQLNYCQEKQLQLAVLFLDLDNFKPVNDALGHSAGDILLSQLSSRLNSCLNEQQHVIRFGGDEFLFLVPYEQSTDSLTVLANRIITETVKPFNIMHTQLQISGSVGIAVASADDDEFSVLCRKADMAMYKAKEDGRNTFRFYDSHMDQANVDKFNLLQNLRSAINSRQFSLYYQPKISLRSGQITSVEALLRWQQADGRFVSPTEFIPLAESSGLITELGAWVIDEACQACARIRRQGYPHLRIAVNLSYVQFKNGQLEHVIKQALQRAALPASSLELELTESLLIDDDDFIKRQLDALSTLGVTFAIDDFGTGYSNLSYLRSFNATTLKIDRSFIMSLCQSERDEPLVKAIIQMAASLGLKTVAEGIEDAQTAQLLTQLGCDEGQGYYWAPALPEQSILTMLNTQP